MAGGTLNNWNITGTTGLGATEHGHLREQKETYADRIRLKAMQTESKIVQFLTTEREELKGAPKNIFLVKPVPEGDGITATNGDLVLNRARNTALSYGVVPREKRIIIPEFWEHAQIFDPRDEAAILRTIGPDQAGEKAVMGAFHRKMDKYVINALDGAVTVFDDDDNSGTSTAFAADGGSTVDVLGPDASATTFLGRGLNTDKLIDARRILEENDALEMGARVIVVCHPKQAAQLLQDAKVQDADFNTLRPLTMGQVTDWMGMTIISTTAVEAETGTDPFSLTSGVGSAGGGRYAYVFTDDSVTVGLDPIDTFFDVVPHLGRSLQLLHQTSLNAIRLDGKKVVRVECIDAATSA